jgi:diguanylate cyclase (GGDEF)-like protein
VNTYLLSPAGAFTITYTMIKLGSPGSYWPVLLVLGYYFVLPERRAWFFNVLTVLIVAPSAWWVLDQSSAVRFSAALVGVSLFAYNSMREINVLHGLLKEQAVTDKLTGLFNRALLDNHLQHAIAQNRRSGVPMTLVALDIDHFKSINDTLGHDTGDVVLKGLGNLLRKRTRGSDTAYRIGGEEFLVLVHNADERQGAGVAESLRREVERTTLLPDRHVTISAGVSGLGEGMDAATWIKACDEKLYRAKQGGRNRVIA